MADEFEIFRNEFRPVHVAKLENKIACPHPAQCEEAVFLQRKRHKIWQVLRPASVVTRVSREAPEEEAGTIPTLSKQKRTMVFVAPRNAPYHAS